VNASTNNEASPALSAFEGAVSLRACVGDDFTLAEESCSKVEELLNSALFHEIGNLP
jgi:hypothetical protein